MKKKVLITGGTGFVGKNLTHLLVQKGFQVSILSRSKRKDEPSVSYHLWDVKNQLIDEEAVLNANYIIHLAGTNIAGKRWTSKRKKEIVDSRVQPVQLIESVLKKHRKQIEVFVSASGIGIYGAKSGSRICLETKKAATDFLGTTCVKWEAAADSLEPFTNRVVKVRTGLVLGENGGFLGKLLPVFKWRLGSAIGSGRQYMPWIHIDDLCAIYFLALTNDNMNGAYNAAINDNTNNSVFSKTLAKVLGYSIWLPNIPSFLIQVVMGEMAAIILKGRRVSSEKIESLGFQFRFKKLEQALIECL
ncbi:TIGR01777 family oxidoreductase [Flavobacterium faecale]|uniref:TIGR01777 family oxidoreductase n=1 Tax=Flavobacterium faecale TaxID=1355330 RepID=UPI003AAF42FC